MPWEPLPDHRDPEPAPMRAGLDRLVRHLGGSSAGSMSSLFDRWSEFVGDTMSTHCRPVSLRAGVLIVAVDDPAWATEIRYLEPALKVRLNAELQEDAIASIEVRVRPRTGGNT
ncbi:MAG: DUF721 domain-containing protein [Actinobacteria bacterium]|nr:DUF721 domain-containing protein [Actinomycetota bacterium]